MDGSGGRVRPVRADRGPDRLRAHAGRGRSYSGLGVGSALVQQSLDDVRSKDLTVRPVCPFYKTFLDEHPEYADLLS